MPHQVSVCILNHLKVLEEMLPNLWLTCYSRKEVQEEYRSLRSPEQMVKEGTVTSVTGKKIPIVAETVCIHGDGEHAVEFAKAIHTALKESNIAIKCFFHFINKIIIGIQHSITMIKNSFRHYSFYFCHRF